MGSRWEGPWPEQEPEEKGREEASQAEQGHPAQITTPQQQEAIEGRALNREVTRSDMQEKAKTKGDFNTQESGKKHRELNRGKSEDPFILRRH